MMDPGAFRSEPQARSLVERIHALVREPVSLMEVCGTHTVAISRYGLRSLMPEGFMWT
jgi:hydrogenase expression/formation protein HypD